MTAFTKARGVFDAQAKEIFLNFYREFGMMYKAAEAAGVCGPTVYKHLKDDAEFAAEFEEAKGVFRDKIEQEITRRAMEGVEEYVTTGKGLVYVESTTEFEEVVLTNPKTGEQSIERRPKMVPLKQRRFSDPLLMFHAKRHIPEYREKQQLDINHTGGVLLVPAEQLSPDQWQLQHGQQPAIEAKPTQTPQLSAPRSVNKDPVR